METPVLLQTKFLIPRPGPDRLPRPHLTVRLEKSLERRVILVSAPPGYGKTSLLAEWAAHTSLPLVWYQLDVTDGDPMVFISYLIGGLRRLETSIGGGSCALLHDDRPHLPQHIIRVLINELAEAIEGDWALVLEDYHLITNPAVHAMTDMLVENGPPGLHVIISTRSDPPLALARWRAKGLLAEIRTSDLRFGRDEVLNWLRKVAPGISEHSAFKLSEKTEGWVTGLQLVLSSLTGRSPEEAERFITELGGTNRYIFEYLAGEVFEQQSAKIRDFLLRTAVLGQMNAASCQALTGISDTQSMLEKLEERNLFLISLDDQREWFRYHHLFREFLLGKLRRENPELARSTELAAARYYESGGEPEIAFNHYLRAGDHESAARVLEHFAQDYLDGGRAEVVNRYLAALPGQILQTHPDLLLFYGDTLRHLGRTGEAITRYEEARSAFAGYGRADGICRALTELAEMARSQGDYRRARDLAAEALEHATPDDHAGRARALMALAKCEGFLTGMDRGRALAEQAVEEARMAEGGVSKRETARQLRSLGQICWWHGDPQAAVARCREALRAAPDRISPMAAEAMITMATPYLYWGELDTALQCAERGLEICQRLQLNKLLPMAYATLGNVLTRAGHIAQAEGCLRQAIELARDLGAESYAQVMASGFLAFNLCRQGRVDEARQLAEAALWPLVGRPDTYELCVCRSVLADVWLESGQMNEAEALFKELLETTQRRKFRIPLAMVYFGLAYIYLIVGRHEEGLEMARRSLELISPTNAFQLYLDQGERAVVVCRALLETGIRDPFLSRVMESLPGGDAERSNIAVSTPTGTINVRCLGTFRVGRGDQEIEHERWVSAKARDLLAYFVTFRREKIPLERALEALWPEERGRTSKTAFHTALYRLRQALRTPDQSTKFILVEAGDYWLDSAYFQIDVDEFDIYIAKARALGADEAAQWYEKAIALYGGDYLSNMYYDWCMPERRRLQEAYLSALRALSAYRAGQGELEAAIELAHRALQIDPLIESLHCDLMRYYSRLGDRGAVARQYRILESALRVELGASPLPSTRRLYARLLGLDAD